MARSRGFRSHRTSGHSRKVSWAEGPAGSTGALTASGNSLFGTAQQFILDDLTVIRMHGELEVMLTAASAVLEGVSWAFGMAIVSENAAGIGVTAVPAPLTDVAWDGWLVHEEGVLFARDATPLDDPNLLIHREIDSKAMRKSHATDVLIACFEIAEVGTATAGAVLISRQLVKLP